MANKYWVGGTGTWDATNTTNWSLTSGGTGGAAVPTTADVAIFDSESNVAGSGASYTVTRTATTSVLGINMANPSAGTLTFNGSSNISVTTSGLTISGTINWTNTGSLSFNGTTAICNTGTSIISSPVVVNGNSITVTLNGAFSTSSTLTLTVGTLSIGTNKFTALTANISGSTTRTFNFGTGDLTLTGSGTTIFDAATQTGLKVSGTPTINCTYSGSTGTRTINAGANATELSFNFTAGTDIVTFTADNRVNNLNFTGFSGTVSNIAISIYGNLILSPTMILTAGTRAWTFFANVSRTITTNGKLLDFPINFNGTGVWTLQDAFTVGSTRTTTLNSGTLNLNNFTLTTGLFVSTGLSARTLNFGTSGIVSLSGTGTVFNTTSSIAISGFPTVNLTNSSATARTITTGALSEASVNVTAGTGNVSTSTSTFKNLDFTGFSGAWIPTAGTIYGNLTLGTGQTVAAYTSLTFAATSTGKTITSNGVTLNGPATFDGVGGGWTLQDALNIGTNQITVTKGSFDTGNYNVTAGSISSSNSNIRSITLGTSTVTLNGQSPITFNSTELTFSGISSTINCTHTAAIVNFLPDGQSFGTVNFTANTFGYSIGSSVNSPSPTITFINLNIPARDSVGVTPTYLGGDVVITSTLTVSSTELLNRTLLQSNQTGSPRVITAASTDLSNVDFRYITGSGTATWSGTSLGDAGGNSLITFAAPKTVYWNRPGVSNWSSPGWALTSGGTPDAANFPLVQDTCIVDDNSAGSTLTLDQNWYIGTYDTTARSTLFTLSYGTTTTYWCGSNNNMMGVSAGIGCTLNYIGVNKIQLVGYQPTNITNIDAYNSTIKVNVTNTGMGSLTLTNGTLDLNEYSLSLNSFSSSNSNTRSIMFGSTGYLKLEGTGTIWNTATVTNLTTSGLRRVDVTAVTSLTRTISAGVWSEDYAFSFNITAGTGPVTFTANNRIKNLDFTGFAGSWTNVALGIYGSLTVSTGMTVAAGTNTVSFLSTYTGNTINPNGKTLGFPIVFNGLFGRWTLTGQLSTGTTSTSTIRLAAGYLDLNGNNHSCPAFITNSNSARTLAFNYGSLTLNGTGTVWDATNVYNMTVTGTPIVNVTNATATARTIIAGSPSESNSVSFNITAGTSSTTVTGNVRNLVFTGFAGTWPNSAITIYGNLTLSTGMTVTAGAGVRTFASTSAGKIITSSGKALGCPITFNGIGGEWTLADAINLSTYTLTLTNGSFSTSNFNVTAGSVSSSNSNTRSLTLGSSTITLSSGGWDITVPTGLTLSSGTSTINLSAASQSFNGGEQTYYNVSFTSGGSAESVVNSIRGSNVFNNLTIAGRTVTGVNYLQFNANQTINGTLNIGAGTGPAYRTWLLSQVFDTQITLTVAAISSLVDVDFRDIVVAGTSGNWSGTRLGDCGNNSNITFESSKTVYWNLTGTVNWSANGWATSSGGTPAVNNFPLAQDTAIFDNTGAATTVTFDGLYNTGTINMSARTTVMTLAFGSSTQFVYSDFILGTGVTPTTLTGQLAFLGYTKTQTLNTAGKSFPIAIASYSPSTTVLLGGAFTSTNAINLVGNLDTSNYSVSATTINASEYATINLNGSTVTLSATGTAWQALSTNTINAGTSTIVLTSTTPTFTGGDKTYYNVTFNNTAINTANITGVNTFNNLNIAGRTGSVGISQVIFGGGNQTVNGTLTIGAGTSAIYRTFLQSNTQGTARTITANAISALTDVDFRDITAAGAAGTWTGIRLGDCGNNTNITTSTPKTVYWNLLGNSLWTATAWATTAAGTPAVANFPLAQDTATFTNTGVASTLTINANWNIGTLNYSSRTTASTLAIGTTSPDIYGNVTLYSGLTITGTGVVTFNKSGATQTITSAGVTWPTGINVYNTNSGTTKLGSALTCSGTVSIYTGTLDLNGFTATVSSLQPAVSASIYDFPAIAFGSSAINITGNNGTILYMEVSGGNFNYTGIPTVNLTYSGSTGTRTIFAPGMTETTCFDINITAGSDIISFSTGGVPSIRNYNDTGFTGTYNMASKVNIYGNMTNNSAVLTGFVNFLATSGTKTLTINTTSNACGAFLTFNCPGAIYQLGSAINLAYYSYGATLNTTGGMILKAGTFNANGYDVTVPEFSSSYTSSRALIMGSGNWTIVPYNLTYLQYLIDVSAYSALIPIFGWDISDPTNLTLDKGTANIICTTYSIPVEYQFYGGDQTYNNFTVTPSSTTLQRSTLSIYGNNTFDTMSNTVKPTTIKFEGGSTQTFSSFNISGDSSSLVTITSTNTTPAILKKSTAWNVGANSTNGGNNTGLSFTGTSPNYLSISYITGSIIGAIKKLGAFLAFF